MDEDKYSQIKKDLNLTQKDISVLLNVNIRTARRWESTPEDMPTAASEALIAWHKLWLNGIAWVPDNVELEEVVRVVGFKRIGKHE